MAIDWQAKADKKRRSILGSIPPKWRLDKIPTVDEQKDVTGAYIQQFLTTKQVEITETDAVGIVKQTITGRWSALEVTKAFCHRAALAHQLVNCLHEIFFDAALDSARRLDAYFAEHKKPIGPLHGLPISLKDQFHVKGVETTMGYVGWIGTFEGIENDPRRGTFESEIVRELRCLGAVLYCKTSVPHTLMSGETLNNIIGYTFNPKNRHLCSGGSSGGEGALLGLKGSPLGVGTDIGGSIRIPSAFNGLYGIRPTAGRMPYEGVANSMDGQNSILSVVGPLAPTAASLKLFMKSVLSTKPWLYDPMVIDMPWRDEQELAVHEVAQSVSSTGGLAFGVYWTDGIANPQPPVVRAISMLTCALKKAGHKIIDWKPPCHHRFAELINKSWVYDGGNDIHRAFALSGEPVSPQIMSLYGKSPFREYTGSQIAANNVAKRRFQKEYMDYWNSTTLQTGTGRPIDGVIAPIAPYPAAQVQEYKYFGYASFVNGLDYTSVVVPVTIADKHMDRYENGYKPCSEVDKQVFDNYDAEMYDGAHVGLQIVGRRFTEEKMLAIAEYVGELLSK